MFYQIYRLALPALCFLWAFCPVVSGQNTLDGVAKIVPESEVNRQSLFIEAEGERLLGHFEKAVAKYKEFLYDNGENAAAWYGLARTYAELKEYVKAIDAAAKAVQKDPTNPWYHILRADLFEKVGQAPDAVVIYQDLVKRFPQNPEYYERLAYLAVLAGDPKEGLRALDQLEKLTGLTEITADKKHMIYLGMGNVKKAAAELEKLADTYPRHPEYRHRLAEFYLSIGDQDQAKKVYQDILRRNPNDDAAQIALLDKSGSDLAFLSALKPFFKDPSVAIDGKIKEIFPYFEKLSRGLDPAAQQALLELADLVEAAHPTDAKAWSLSGDLYYHSGRSADALQRYRNCIRLNPTVFSVWENTLAILLEQKNYAELLKMAERAMDDFPNQALAYYYYGAAAVEQGKPDDAIDQLQQAQLMAGNNLPLQLDIADQVGLALLKKKDFEAARRYYESWLPKGGAKHHRILEHYGDALYQTGAGAQAIEFWQKANQLSPSPALQQKISSGKL